MERSLSDWLILICFLIGSGCLSLFGYWLFLIGKNPINENSILSISRIQEIIYPISILCFSIGNWIFIDALYVGIIKPFIMRYRRSEKL